MIFLIDASVYVFRAYYSMLPDMTDRDGNASHAVFGFAKFIGDLLERARPQYIAVAFDQSLMRSFRNRIYPAYKANREPPPADLVLQFERCREYCSLMGIATFASEEYEADDIIGTLACTMRREGVRAAVISRDKDLAQLIREGDVYWDYASRQPSGYFDIERHFGVPPECIADYLALTGDSVDNIPGVPGVGPKTAATLMRQFGSLERLYEQLDRVADLNLRGVNGLADRLREHRDAVFLARELTLIKCDMPLEVNGEGLRRQLPDIPRLNDFYDLHQFGPLLRRQSERLAQLPLV